MICLADTDLILKLAACDIIQEALSVLGTQDRDVMVLPEAKTYFSAPQNKRAIRDRCTAASMTRIDTFLSNRPVCQMPFSATDLTALSVSGIDPGERAFFAVTDLTCIMATGDRRCLSTLAKQADKKGGDLAAIHQRWKGRIAWFDQILLAVAKTQPTLIHQRIWPGCACDEALIQAFHSGAQTPGADVMAHWQRRIAQVKKDSNGLLVI